MWNLKQKQHQLQSPKHHVQLRLDHRPCMPTDSASTTVPSHSRQCPLINRTSSSSVREGPVGELEAKRTKSHTSMQKPWRSSKQKVATEQVLVLHHHEEKRPCPQTGGPDSRQEGAERIVHEMIVLPHLEKLRPCPQTGGPDSRQARR